MLEIMSAARVLPEASHSRNADVQTSDTAPHKLKMILHRHQVRQIRAQVDPSRSLKRRYKRYIRQPPLSIRRRPQLLTHPSSQRPQVSTRAAIRPQSRAPTTSIRGNADASSYWKELLFFSFFIHGGYIQTYWRGSGHSRHDCVWSRVGRVQLLGGLGEVSGWVEGGVGDGLVEGLGEMSVEPQRRCGGLTYSCLLAFPLLPRLLRRSLHVTFDWHQSWDLSNTHVKIWLNVCDVSLTLLEY